MRIAPLLLVGVLCVPLMGMDFTDIQTVNELAREDEAITRAIDVLDHGGRIVSMTVSTEPGAAVASGTPMVGAIIPTTHISYPPQMVDAIKSALTARQHEISDEMTKMGVTGAPSTRAKK